MAGAERLCHIFEWGREMKKVGNHCFTRTLLAAQRGLFLHTFACQFVDLMQLCPTHGPRAACGQVEGIVRPN